MNEIKELRDELDRWKSRYCKKVKSGTPQDLYLAGVCAEIIGSIQWQLYKLGWLKPEEMTL